MAPMAPVSPSNLAVDPEGKQTEVAIDDDTSIPADLYRSLASSARRAELGGLHVLIKGAKPRLKRRTMVPSMACSDRLQTELEQESVPRLLRDPAEPCATAVGAACGPSASLAEQLEEVREKARKAAEVCSQLRPLLKGELDRPGARKMARLPTSGFRRDEAGADLGEVASRRLLISEDDPACEARKTNLIDISTLSTAASPGEHAEQEDVEEEELHPPKRAIGPQARHVTPNMLCVPPAEARGTTGTSAHFRKSQLSAAPPLQGHRQRAVGFPQQQQGCVGGGATLSYGVFHGVLQEGSRGAFSTPGSWPSSFVPQRSFQNFSVGQAGLQIRTPR